MRSTEFELYSKPEYFADLTARAAEAGKDDRVTLMTMNFDPSVPVIEGLVSELSHAASRGAEVHLIIDAMDLIMGHNGRPGPLFYGKRLSDKLTGESLAMYQSLEWLREKGGHYHVINQPARSFSVPVAGRSHMKLALINDRVNLGGCNLDSENYIDLMIGWDDAKTAQWLYGLTAAITAAGNVKAALNGVDQTHAVDDNTTIFVDSGVKKQSLIYDQALQVVDRSDKNALITCQYFPGGPTAQHLLAAQDRGVDVSILYNNPNKHRQSLGQKIYNFRERQRLPASFFVNELPVEEQKLHAKVIATEREVFVGSHNYIDVGVNLGTAEIAFLCKDPALSVEVASYFEPYIASKRT